jgi:basic membrane lipoprotein Med (substrate-binding protein (PBP1-ABC) superfamily)
MTEEPRLDLRFNNRECQQIKKAAAAERLDVKTFIKQIGNTEPRDYTNMINLIIYEAIDAAAKRITASSLEKSRS